MSGVATSGLTTSLISLGGVLAAAGISAAVAYFTARRARKEKAEEVLKRYREPLAAAAFDLQSRLYNILCLSFFDTFGADHERFELAEKTTLFRFAQYFGWTEILRRDIQFLSFPKADATKGVVELQLEISRCLNTSRDHQFLMLWADEQRAIGEKMIVEEHDKVLCMGYARFAEEYDERFELWCARLRSDLQSESGHDRLRTVQHKLCELVEALDPERIRYAAKDLGPA
jgi:hypothetical protein